MKRYAVTVCSNCGTEYNSTRAICPGYRCGQETPDAVEPAFKRKFTGPKISAPDQLPSGAGQVGTKVAANNDVEPKSKAKSDKE